MTSPQTDDEALVILVAANSPVLRGLRDVLRDWVAFGLSRPFLWIDESDADVDLLADIVATHVTTHSAARVRLADFLADRHAVGLLRLVPVSVAGAESMTVSQRVAGQTYTGLNGIGAGQISPVHCVLARHGMGGWNPEPTWNGWHTVIVAPEDAWTPQLVATDLTYRHSDQLYTGHVAAGLAGLTGLWIGVGEAPFDKTPVGTLPRPVVARAYLRRLDASGVAAAVRRKLTDVSDGLPRPRHGHAVCEHLRKPDAAAVNVARAVIQKHRGLFATQRVQSQTGPQQLGTLAALRMFLSFVWSAIRRAPWTLVNNARSHTSAALSRRLQNAIFGPGDSQFELVTAGLTADGLPAGAADLARSAEELARRVHTVSAAAEQVVPDAAPFWRDVVSGALTLADGGERSADVPPVMVGGLPGVVPDAGYLAPSPDVAFVLPGQLAAVIGVDRVESHDIWAQDQVADRLGTAGTDLELARAGDAFDTWRRDVGRAYTSEIGRHLARELKTRTAAVADLLKALREVTAEVDNTAPSKEDQFQALRIVGVMVFGLVVIAAAVTSAVKYEWLSLQYTISFAVTLAILWTAWLLYALYQQEQRLFTLLTSRNTAGDRAAAAAGNVGFAVAELQVAAVLYQQYLAWTPVLGRFLLQPFGPVPEPVPPPRLVGPLPRAMGLGIAHPDPEQIAVVTHDLGSVVFDRGWLSSLWANFEADAPRRIGTAGLALRNNTELLYTDEAATATSPLRLWSSTVIADGVKGTAGEALWRDARSQLLRDGLDDLSAKLFGDVEVIGQSGPGGSRLTGTTFLTDLIAAIGEDRAQHFSTSLFEPGAVAYDPHKVGTSIVIGGPGVDTTKTEESTARWLPPAAREQADLDQFVVVVQLTEPVPAEQLRLLAPFASVSTAAEVNEQTSPDTLYPDLGI